MMDEETVRKQGRVSGAHRYNSRQLHFGLDELEQAGMVAGLANSRVSRRPVKSETEEHLEGMRQVLPLIRSRRLNSK